MKDSWCKPIWLENGKKVSGGAARNVRISAAGGMDQIIERAARDAAARALELANNAVFNNKTKGHPLIAEKLAGRRH